MKSSVVILLAAMLPSFAAAQPPIIAGIEKAGAEKVAGAVLMSELACAACHASTQTVFAAKTAPDLSMIGSRAHPAHLQRFIASPSNVKPGTTMPDVLAHLPEKDRNDAAEALMHFLATLGKQAPSALPTAEAIERGKKLYHSVGCVACHSPEKPLPGSVPHGPLAEKYTLASLTAFLQDPLSARPGGRMPDCQLENGEAADIASYLLRDQKTPFTPFQVDAALASRGQKLFVEHRCNACHATGAKTLTPPIIALNKLRAEEGCLSAKKGAWPHYPLSEGQRTALRSALADEAKSFSPAEVAQITLTRLNCITCHVRGEIGGVSTERSDYFSGRDETLGEQTRIPPALTGVGAKLKEKWLREVLVNGASARPYIHTRMPKFGAAQTEHLAALFKQLDLPHSAAFTRVGDDKKPREIGRELAGVKGFNCIACHTFRGRSASPIRALDLTTMAERVEENWFHNFLAHPQKFVPLTVMPGFWPDGKSLLPAILGGNPGMQRDALWQYLAQGPEAREPAGLILEPLVVKVQNEAVIVRRAFPGIGKRGIGIGYPGGINLAFDAELMRLATLWSGDFIEASSLWRGQGSGQARILGKPVVEFPPGPAFAVLATADATWPVLDMTTERSPFSFKGYSLDAQQRPTLKYALPGVEVTDFFMERRDDSGSLYLQRTLTFSSPSPAGFHLRVASGTMIEAQGANTFAVGTNLVIKMSAQAVLRDAGDAKELLLPVRGDLKLEYHLKPASTEGKGRKP
ncbi:MAG: c-type cytochrome [Verrucomicrobiaceae bacterium]|nr:c-type cytochrome [Verrucomicrobiaceae bacterium]